MLLDSHCHLQDKAYSLDLDRVINDAVQEGVTKMVCIGTNLENSEKAIKLTTLYPEIYATAGIYPHEEIPKEDFRPNLIKLAKNKSVIAIGECGLDYTENGRSKDEQKELFRKQIGTALQLDLPLVIHNRNADNDILEELSHYKSTGKLRGVFHCFVGSLEFAKKVLDLGFHISFTGIITYPSAKHLEEVIKELPKDKILIETDSPYLPPQGFRDKRNEPKYVRIIAERIAEILKITVDDLALITSRNAEKLFNIE